jgi:ABC-type Mn2+/Zn2+ transport system permease subunit
LEALFGNLEKIGMIDGIITIAGAVIIFALTAVISKKLILGIVSEDLAKTSGVDMGKVNLIYLLLVGLVVALGVKFVGTLLTGALVIIPAVTAKNLARSIKNYQFLSVLSGILSVIIGIIISGFLGISAGPVIVLVGIVLFGLSYFFK